MKKLNFNGHLFKRFNLKHTFLSSKASLAVGAFMSVISVGVFVIPYAQAQAQNSSKVFTSQQALQPFPHDTDASMQSLLEKSIAKRNLNSLIASKQLSVTLVDITDLDKPKMAHLNGKRTLYAASLPKLGIMLAVFEEIHQGRIKRTPELMNSLELMIRKSSNVEATRLYNLVGAKRIAEILRSERYNFYDMDEGGGLWIGKPYAKTAAWQRDPLKNISHAASGVQVARFYYMLERNELTNPAYCPLMKEILSDSAINHKFVKGLRSIHPRAKVYRKSGTWRDYHADSALVERQDGRTYIAVVLSQQKQGGQLLEKIITDLDEIIDQSS